MNQNKNNSVEEEFRSSQIYKTLRDSGIPAAGKIAAGLDAAVGGIVQGLDKALNGAVSGTGKGPAQPQPSHTGRQPFAQNGQPRPASQRAGNPYQYAYQYRPQGGQKTAQTARPAGQQPIPRPNVRPGQRPAGVSPAPAPQMPRMKMVRKKSPAKFYITGAAALLYALWFPLYEPAHFIVFGLALVGIFLLSGKLFKGKKEFVPEEPEKPREEPKKEKPEEKPSQTGNPEVDKIINEGNEYLKKLRALNDAIPDETLTEDISRMEKAAADIFRFIQDHPEKAPQIRKFMSYYLPTTLKLLNSYQRLSSQSAKGENITSTMFNIAGMMHTVADAFEKQLDSLFTDEAMDISADISVFETLLKQEGFVEEKKKN